MALQCIRTLYDLNKEWINVVTVLATFFIIVSVAGLVDYRARYCLQSLNMGARQPITYLSAHLMGQIKGTAQQEWMGLAIKILLMCGNVRDLIPPHSLMLFPAV